MSQDVNIKDLRQQYETRSLAKSDADKSPFKQFKVWLEEVIAENLVEPTAMNIATVSKGGEISSRMVLLKEFDDKGLPHLISGGINCIDKFVLTVRLKRSQEKKL